MSERNIWKQDNFAINYANTEDRKLSSIYSFVQIYEVAWGAITRPDGIAFAKEPSSITDYFHERFVSMEKQNTAEYSLYEKIGTPRLCKVSEDCLHFYDYKCPKGEVLWLRGDSLEEFIQGVEL